jgi:hypothetical protein
MICEIDSDFLALSLGTAEEAQTKALSLPIFAGLPLSLYSLKGS